MTRISTVIATAAIVLAATTSAFADGHSKVVGGAEMFPDKNIVENAVNSADHTTLVAAVVQEGTAYWAHVGDSRLYLFSDGCLIARTEDHLSIDDAR